MAGRWEGGGDSGPCPLDPPRVLRPGVAPRMSSAPDRIQIDGLTLFCTLGWHGWERLVQREVRINVTLYADLCAVGVSDDIRDTVNYSTVVERVVEFVTGSSFRLVEALATGIADLCLSYDPVQAVDVRVSKLGASAVADEISVTVSRRNDA